MENGSVIYGFAFVDCAALKFWIGSISDDASCAALGALLMQVCSSTSALGALCSLFKINIKIRNILIFLFGYDFRCHLRKSCMKIKVRCSFLFLHF